MIIILAIFLFNLEIGTKQRDSLRNSVYISLNTPLEPIPDTQNSTAELPDFVKGIDFYPTPYSYDDSHSIDSLRKLLSIPEVNFIQIRFFLEQRNLKSVDIHYNKVQDITLARMIGMIHRAGKHVCLEVDFNFLEPNIYVADLDPVNKKIWFFFYKRALAHYAVFAQNNKVELLSIGNEMHSLFPFSQDWKEIIAQTRQLYKGKITVKLNCWWQEKTFRKILSWQWLNDVDYIGFSPYFDLTSQKASSIEELTRAWTDSHYNRHGLNIEKELEAISQKFQKKILFLEIGYRTIKNCTIEPWNSAEIVPQGSRHKVEFSEKESVLAIEALNEVFKKKSWFAGIFWFYWGTTKPPPRDTSWNIRGKDSIMKQIREGFKEE